MSKNKSNELFGEIQKLLSTYAQKANEWARFSQRDTPLNAEKFLQVLVLGWLKDKNASLNQLALSAKDLGLSLSASAIHERMGKEAVMLLASVLRLALEDLRKPCPLPVKALERFSGIYVTDSTQIALSPKLACIFQGNQGNSMLKLQVAWDYLHGNLAALELEAGKSPDQNARLHLSHAYAGSLQLFDLGYFKQEYLAEIDEKGAYFVSRYQAQTALYELESQKRFDLQAWLKSLGEDEAEIELLLGQRVQLKVRLLARRLSPEARQARQRKAKKKARKQKKGCSETYLFLLGWDILLSNLATSDWTLRQIFELYPIRFQIEWLFRIWKDQLGLDDLGDWSIERLLSQLYAHLLGAILVFLLTASRRWEDFEYSLFKSVQVIQKAVKPLMTCLRRSGWGFAAWLKRLEDDFRQFARKNKRRKSPSTLQTIDNWGLS
jgi:hypothetical protein